jgi:hypothetical protein
MTTLYLVFNFLNKKLVFIPIKIKHIFCQKESFVLFCFCFFLLSVLYCCLTATFYTLLFLNK